MHLSRYLLGQQQPAWKPGQTFEDVKKNAFRLAMTHFNGNRKSVAKALGLSRRVVSMWLNRFPDVAAEFPGCTRPQYRRSEQ